MGKVKLYFDDKVPASVSVTEQSHKGACDINKIIARAEKTGTVPVSQVRGSFGDMTGIDYVSLNVKMARAREAFMRLPVNVRTRFNNDVGELLTFIDNPLNKDEAVKLGLREPDRKPEVDAAAARAAAGAGQGAPAGSPA